MVGALPEIVKASLRQAAGARPVGDPLTITFATGDFTPLLMNWLWFAAKAGVNSPLVVAMDAPLAERLARDGLSFVRHAYDGSLADLWVQRMLIFEFLAAEGVDFIHSDIDAVWLSDPRPFCFADSGFDLIFSQGTNYPPDVRRLWGFVLCCGLFAVRARPAAAAFFVAARDLAARVGDDQAVVNILLARGGLVWNTAGRDSYPLDIRGQSFTAYRRMLDGYSEPLGLRVGLLPHHLFPRLPTSDKGPIVKHPLGPGNPREKMRLLRAMGCWREQTVDGGRL